jgi:hypothetical protein
MYCWSKAVERDPSGTREHELESTLVTHPLTHAASLWWLLNTDTGLVSPQFHIKFDNLFEMVSSMNLQVQRSKCTGFTKLDEPAPTEPPIPDTYQLPPQVATPAMEQPTQETQPQPHLEKLVPMSESATPSKGVTPDEGDTSIPTQSWCRRVTFNLPSIDDATTGN